MKNYRLYSESALQQIDDIIMKHQDAMTSESLHSKAEIAIELAVRDAVIGNLGSLIQEAHVICEGMQEFLGLMLQDPAPSAECKQAAMIYLTAIENLLSRSEKYALPTKDNVKH